MKNLNLKDLQNPRIEMIGVFQDQHELEEAIHELETEIPRQSFSVLESGARLKEVTGHRRVDPKMAAQVEGIPKRPPIYPEEKTIGMSAIVSCSIYIAVLGGILSALSTADISSIVSSAVIGGILGAALGLTIVAFIKNRIDSDTNRQIKAGGLPLWISIPSVGLERKARQILRKHGATDIQSYPLA